MVVCADAQPFVTATPHDHTSCRIIAVKRSVFSARGNVARKSHYGLAMNHDTATMSLAELAGAEPLRPVHAVTIVHAIIARIAAGTIAGVPSPQVIRLSATGRITVEGPIAADARTVWHAAHLLSTLLPGFEARGATRSGCPARCDGDCPRPRHA